MPVNLARLRAMLSLQRLAGQTLVAFVLKGIGAVASFALAWLIARRFGAEGSGLFGIVVTTLTFVTTVILCGLDSQLLRIAAGDLREAKTAEARSVVRRVTRTLMLVSPAAALLLWLGHEWLARHVLDQPRAAPLLGIMVWALVPLVLIRLASSTLRAWGQVLASQLIDGPLGTGLAVLALAATFLLGLVDSLAMVGFFYLGAVSVGAVAGWMAWKRPKAAVEAQPPALLPIALAGLPVLLSALSNLFTEWYTTLSLGSLRTAAEVGHYRVAWQFVGLLGLVQIAMEAILAPRIAGASRVGDKAEIAHVARRASLLMLLLGAPLLLIFLLFPGTLLGLFGQEFRAGALALQVLAIGQIVRLAGGPLGTIIIMTGHQRWILAYAAAGVALCIIFCLAFIPPLGAVGAALATTATILLRTIGATIIVNRVIGINLLRRDGR